jgi:outer membrane protein TolC
LRGALALASLPLILLAGCSAAYYHRSADAEVYDIIDAKASLVSQMPARFRIEGWSETRDAGDALGAAADGRQEQLTLAEVLAVAAANSREFQSEREDVYLEALDLTLARFEFANQYAGFLSFLWSRTRSEAKTAGVTTRTTDTTVDGSGVFSVSRTLATGASITLALSTGFLRYLSGDPRNSIDAALDLSIRQPLLRGAWRRNVQEGLIQAERDMVYGLRDFMRFRRGFYVRVAREYYRVLQQRDRVENERMNLDNLVTATERARLFAGAGRLPEFEVQQTEQDRLTARQRWIRAIQRYESQLDEFKITLGIPTETPLALDRQELSRLGEDGLQEAGLARPAAVEAALRLRLDLLTSKDEVDDAARKLAVAVDDLKADVDLVLGAGKGRTRSTDSGGVTTRIRDSHYSAGLDVDLPLNRKAERNAYTRAMITLDRATRDEDLLRDRIKQQIYSAWRLLVEAEESYTIQDASVTLAKGRVESTTILLEEGRARVRDLLESQEALVQAKNNLTGALVDYRLAVLDLWRDMEALSFENGEFKREILDEQSVDG